MSEDATPDLAEPDWLSPKAVTPLTGDERFSDGSCAVGDFWRWAFSDLRTNIVRDVLAEFLPRIREMRPQKSKTIPSGESTVAPLALPRPVSAPSMATPATCSQNRPGRIWNVSHASLRFAKYVSAPACPRKTWPSMAVIDGYHSKSMVVSATKA